MLRLSLLLGILLSHVNAHIIRQRSLEVLPRGEQLQVTPNVLTLQKSALKPGSSIALGNHITSSNSTTLKPVSYGSGYAATVNLQGTDLLLLVDTGSSDTWIATEHFQCVSPYGKRYPQHYCSFGTLFNGSFVDGPIANENFNVSYGSGEFVIGEVGVMDIEVANVSITQQEIALIDTAFWTGDNETTGIIGFGYEALTSSYQGDDASKDDPETTLIEYSPIVQTALTRGLFSTFSLAIERGSDTLGGYLALGGLPPVKINSSFVTTPVQMTDLEVVGRQGKVYSFYTIEPSGFYLSGGLLNRLKLPFWKPSIATRFPVIVDSGTTLIYLPPSLTSKINALYDPPAKYNSDVGFFETSCNAVAPDLAVQINGTKFEIAAQDLLITGVAGTDPDTGLCITAVQPSSGPYILGDAFLKNVVAVFDVGAHQMQFAAREKY